MYNNHVTQKPDERPTRLEYGFVAFTGVRWLDRHVDSYNNYIASKWRPGQGLSKESLRGSHKLFCIHSSPIIDGKPSWIAGA